jgi:hypothetical protein
MPVSRRAFAGCRFLSDVIVKGETPLGTRILSDVRDWQA